MDGVFNGKKYTRYRWNGTERDARREAQVLRDKGNLVRVVKRKRDVIIYVRPKGW